jgi:hypothetical protein
MTTAAKTEGKAPAKAKKVSAPKPENSGLIAKFTSAGTQYTIVRLTRDVGDKLKAGQRYDVKKSDAGVITLTPAKGA